MDEFVLYKLIPLFLPGRPLLLLKLSHVTYFKGNLYFSHNTLRGVLLSSPLKAPGRTNWNVINLRPNIKIISINVN